MSFSFMLKERSGLRAALAISEESIDSEFTSCYIDGRKGVFVYA